MHSPVLVAEAVWPPITRFRAVCPVPTRNSPDRAAGDIACLLVTGRMIRPRIGGSGQRSTEARTGRVKRAAAVRPGLLVESPGAGDGNRGE